MNTVAPANYVAGFNEPGYLPHVDPVGFDTITEAWAYLASEVRLDQLDLSGHHYYPADSLERQILEYDAGQLEALTDTGTVYIGGLAFWVQVAEH